ncbi:hypothetical protein [Streptococcus alactolyticus]|uniref:hypothetical protein n=1 Tax=Streptococcus alactolyticus TaxID=29389 RepID=UPI00197DB3F7|nr:hypothetical protein [Streptococcus alactolyticus]
MTVDLENLAVDEQVIYLVISQKIEPSMIEDSSNQVVLKLIFSTLEKRMEIPYEFITDFVFSNAEENSTEDNEWLNNNIKLLVGKYKGDSNDTFKKNLNKINRHYNLAQVQKEYILQNINVRSHELEEHIGLLESKTENVQSKIKDSQNLIEKIDNTKSSIYTDFIAILGVFSSFVFVMFGGFSALSEILRSLSQENVSLGKVFLMSSFLMGTIFTIIYSLLLWVSKIIDKPITRQVCKCKTNSCKSLWHAVKRHKFYCIIILTMSLLFLSGLVMIIYFPKI